MNIDIRLSLDFFDHPKSKKLKKRLGLEGVMALLKLWAWTAGNRPGGMLAGLDAEAVELAADWDGEEGAFVSTLLDLRLLDDIDGTFSIHDWEDHQAYASKSEERSSNAKKAAEARWSKAKAMQQVDSSNAQPMLSNATSMQAHAFSNAPETRNQEPVFNTTPDGVVVDAVPGDDLSDAAGADNRQASDGERQARRKSCPPCPHQAIVDLYHELLPELSRIKVWDKERQTNMQARWRDRWKAGKYASQQEGLAYWTRFFEYVRDRCPWLMGQVSDRNGKAFRADLGWMILPRNFKKIIEGRYEAIEIQDNGDDLLELMEASRKEAREAAERRARENSPWGRVAQ